MYRAKYHSSEKSSKIEWKDHKLEYFQKNDETPVLENKRTSLHHAVLLNDVQLVEDAVQAGCDVNLRDQFGLCPIHMASARGFVSVVEKLVLLGANVREFTGCGASPLMVAARQNCTEVVKSLLACPAVNINFHNERHETALHYAVGAGSIESARILLKHGAKVNYCDKEGLTPLLVAVRMKDYKLVKLLVDSKANVNYVDLVGRTPLHWAADLGAVDVVRLLIDCQVNIDATDTNGHTPFVCAIKSNQPEVVKILLDEGCDQHSVDGLMGTPLALASLKGFDECVQVLLDYGADCNEISFFGTTPLQLATFESKVDVVKLLLRKGANPNGESRVGITALIKAFLHVSPENEARRHEIVAILLRAGADANFTMKRVTYFTGLSNGRICPLSFAIISGYLSFVRMLLLAGARMTHKEATQWIAQRHEMHMFDTSQLMACIKEWTDEPISLKYACRNAIRAAMGDRVGTDINQLPIASSLKRFINFEEFDNVFIERAQVAGEYSTELLNMMPQMKSCTLRALEGSLLHSALTTPSTALPRLPYTRSTHHCSSRETSATTTD